MMPNEQFTGQGQMSGQNNWNGTMQQNNQNHFYGAAQQQNSNNRNGAMQQNDQNSFYGAAQQPNQNNGNNPFRQQRQDKNAKAVKVISILGFIFSGLGIVLMALIPVIFALGQTGGGTATAVSNEVVLGMFGIMFCMVGSWAASGIGAILGLIGVIIGLVQKEFRKIWLPILPIVLAIVTFVGTFVTLYLITQ